MTDQELADQDVLNNGGCMVAGSWMTDKEIQLVTFREIFGFYGLPLGYEIVRIDCVGKDGGFMAKSHYYLFRKNKGNYEYVHSSENNNEDLNMLEILAWVDYLGWARNVNEYRRLRLWAKRGMQESKGDDGLSWYSVCNHRFWGTKWGRRIQKPYYRVKGLWVEFCRYRYGNWPGIWKWVIVGVVIGGTASWGFREFILLPFFCGIWNLF